MGKEIPHEILIKSISDSSTKNCTITKNVLKKANCHNDQTLTGSPSTAILPLKISPSSLLSSASNSTCTESPLSPSSSTTEEVDDAFTARIEYLHNYYH